MPRREEALDTTEVPLKDAAAAASMAASRDPVLLRQKPHGGRARGFLVVPRRLPGDLGMEPGMLTSPELAVPGVKRAGDSGRPLESSPAAAAAGLERGDTTLPSRPLTLCVGGW